MTKSKSPVSIMQVDPDRYYIEVVNLVLFPVGLQVNYPATSKRQAEDLVRQITSGQIKPDVAIIEAQIEQNEEEGSLLAAHLRKLLPEIKIIGYTILPEEHKWADAVAIKSQRDTDRTLVQALQTALGFEIVGSDAVDRS